MAENQTLEQRTASLEARNRRVEADKAWETSWTRRLALMALTYLTVVFYLHYVVHINPWINALVPVLGYFVSTLTLSVLRHRFVDRFRRK